MSFLGLATVLTSVKVSALEGVSWTRGAPTVVENIPLGTNSGSGCGGYVRSITISELQVSRSVCMYGDQRLKIGYFSNGGSFMGAVQLPYSDDTHALEGVCNGVTCQYSADTDMLVTQQPISQYGWGVVVYSHASQRVQRVQSASGSVSYVFDKTHPDYEIKNEEGRYLWTPSYAISNNGQWIVVELRDSGLAVIDTNTFLARQITSDGNKYGYGFDPTEQLAISNDGKSVALMGMNAGFSIFDVTPDCGQVLVGDLHQLPTTIRCASSDLTIGALFPNFHYAEQPRFFGNGQQLEVVVNSWVSGGRRVTYVASGAAAVHKLKLLSLGDSFTSGEGETDTHYYEEGTNSGVDTCHVSKRSYPFLIAGALGIDSNEAKSIACAGATTGDIVGSNDGYWGQGGRLGVGGLGLSSSAKATAQSKAVEDFQPGRSLQSTFLERYKPEMITIGVGGNDAGLMGKLSACAMPGTCEWAQGEGLRDTAGEIKRLFGTLDALFSQIAKTNPNAKVYVVGYPDVINADGVCDPLTSLLLDYTERVFIEQSLRYLNRVIRAATQWAGFTYLDVEHSMDGKSLCNGFESTAMNGLRVGDDIAISNVLPMLKVIGAGTFHPTPVGHALEVNTILAGHPGLQQDIACTSDPSACLSTPPNIDPPAYWGIQAGVSNRLSYVADFASRSASDAKRFAVTLPGGTLLPQSSVRVEIHSESASLGEFQTDADGGFSHAVMIPAGIEDGFHALHLFGTNREGKAVDMYQFITVGQGGEWATAGTADAPPSHKETPQLYVHHPLLSNTNVVSNTTNETTGVLGAQAVALQKQKSGLTGTDLVHSAQRGLRGGGDTTLIAIGAGIVFVLALSTILSWRKWAKPSS